MTPVSEHVKQMRLILAAPDLLAACKAALDPIEEWLQGMPELADQIRAAIAKAEDGK